MPHRERIVPRKALAVAAALVVLVGAPTAGAEERGASPARGGESGAASGRGGEGGTSPARGEETGASPARGGEAGAPTFEDVVSRRPDWTAGVVLERSLRSVVGDSLVDDQLFGVSATYFAGGRYGIHARLLVSPNVERFVDTRGVAALGFRLRTQVLGVDTFLGSGAHIEARLRTHYWLAYVAPLELGVTAWKKGSFRVEVFLGVRGILTGDLVNSYLIDPNGVDNAQAEAALAARRARPWESYLSIVLGRVM
ncbi:MAG: hypothetical protein KF850_02295 [Labilithrix sp.]|nr:hypothetical protein [Labilithrix sp.]MBX3210845.1 hypothetical protein [Labilithrix sp.]